MESVVVKRVVKVKVDYKVRAAPGPIEGLMKEFLIRRFKEPSTWGGLMLVGSAFGMDLTEQQQFALSFLGMALAGAPDDSFDKIARRFKR